MLRAIMLRSRPLTCNHRQLAVRDHLSGGMHRSRDAHQLPGFGELRGLDAQFLSWCNWFEKFEPVYGCKQRHGSRALVARLRRPRSQHYAGGLGHGLYEKNSRKNWPGGKMSRKNRARRIYKLHRNTTNSRFELFHAINPQKRRAMRYQRLDLTSLHHLGFRHRGLYTSNISGGIFGFIEFMSMRNTLFTPLLPSTSIERSRKSRLPSLMIR